MKTKTEVNHNQLATKEMVADIRDVMEMYEDGEVDEICKRIIAYDELLEACKKMLKEIHDPETHEGELGNCETDCFCNETFDLIKKAEGQTIQAAKAEGQ